MPTFQELSSAVATANSALTRTVLESFTGDINTINEKGDTLLHIAVRVNSSAITRLLLEKNADPNIANQDGNTALHLAFNTIIFDLLLKHHAEINAVNMAGNTPFHMLVLSGDSDCREWLLKAGVDLHLHQENNNGLTAYEMHATQTDIATRRNNMTASLSQLRKAIVKLQDHGTRLNDAGVHNKGTQLYNLAESLQNKLNGFEDLRNRKSKTDILDEINTTLSNVQNDKSLMAYRGTLNPLIGNILIACTAVGLLVLAGKALHSKATTGRYSLFFKSSSETSIINMQNNRDKLEDATVNIAFSN